MIASAKRQSALNGEKTIRQTEGEIAGLAIFGSEDCRREVGQKREESVVRSVSRKTGEDTEMKTNRKSNLFFFGSEIRRNAFELNIPKETIEKTREIFSEVPQITDVLDNPNDSSREERLES